MSSLIDAIYSVYGFLNPYMEKWSSSGSQTLQAPDGQKIEMPTGLENTKEPTQIAQKLEQFQKIPPTVKQYMTVQNPAIGELWNVSPRYIARLPRSATPTQ